MSLADIRIVLVEPSHGGNIGAAARAMKTMGLTDLCLVRPNNFPSEEATIRAVGAIDILERANVVEDLESAVRDCKLVIGGSARQREFPLPMLDAREAALRLVEGAAPDSKTAVLFGTERDGLSNQALDTCNYQLQIPTNPQFKSLNLASAVQLVSYEIFVASGITAATGRSAAKSDRRSDDEIYPNQEELDFFFQHLESTLDARGYYGAQNPERIHVKVRRLLARARPKKNELQLLHSFVRLMRRDEPPRRNRPPQGSESD